MPSVTYGQSPMFQLLLAEQNKRAQEKSANAGKDMRILNSIGGGLPIIGQLGTGIANASSRGSPVNPVNTQTTATPPQQPSISPSPAPGHFQSQQMAGVQPQNLYPLNAPPQQPQAQAPNSAGLSRLINGLNQRPTTPPPAGTSSGTGAAGSTAGLPWWFSLLG